MKMRGFLLAMWSEKYERIEYEVKRCEARMESLEKRKRILKLDARVRLIRIAIDIPILYFLASMIPYISYYFVYFYIPGLVGLTIFTLGRDIVSFGRQLALMRYHKRKNLPFTYPRPILVDSNYPVNIPPNYYTEGLCCEWLLEKYHYEMEEMVKLRKEIEQASEEDIEPLQKRLEEIAIYEILGGA